MYLSSSLFLVLLSTSLIDCNSDLVSNETINSEDNERNIEHQDEINKFADDNEVNDKSIVITTTVPITSDENTVPITTQPPEGSDPTINEIEATANQPSVKNEEEDSSRGFPKVISTSMIDSNPNYIKGHFGGYYLNGTDDFKFFSHGKYKTPSLNYYGSYKHVLDDKSALGYYLGYGMTQMDRNEYFRHNNFTHYDIHHYFYMNNTMLPELHIGSDYISECARNTTTFCPENTEAVCLKNTTVWCATRRNFARACPEYPLLDQQCVTTRIPCVNSDEPNCHQLIQVIKLPCISQITITDEYEDKKGFTFNNVAGTFVLSPVSPVSERTYCVTIVANPSKE